MIHESLAEDVALTTAWATAIAIPSNTVLIHAISDAAIEILLTNTTGDPAAAGAWYPADLTHEIKCKGITYLHVRTRTGTGDFSATALRSG